LNPLDNLLSRSAYVFIVENDLSRRSTRLST
jgi:hypothetical protein